jgi:putative endonuclease
LVFIYIYKMHFHYIIYSKSIDTFYIGETHDIDERLINHNNHIYSKGFTKAANDWVITL